MSDVWKADRHPNGWAVYRRARSGLEVYRLRADPIPLTFDSKAAAVVWAEILNEFAAPRR